MMNKSYTPIPCSLYSKYESAVLFRQRLRVVWEGSRQRLCMEVLKPMDLRTRRSAEYMIARNHLGQLRVLRLDRIRSAALVGRLPEDLGVS